jgi:hypothetical protein
VMLLLAIANRRHASLRRDKGGIRVQSESIADFPYTH